MDPGSAFLIGKGFDALAGLTKKDWTKQQLAEQAREFNLQQQMAEEASRSSTQLDQTKAVGDMARRMEGAPARDKALFMLSQRLGMVPQSFSPRDMLNPQSQGNANPQGGGIDPAQQQAAMAGYQAPDFTGGSYRPGSGGVDPRVYSQMMARLGYSGPLGHETLNDMPIQRSGYNNPFGERPPGQPGKPNPNGMINSPQAPNGIKVNPPGTPPWGSPPPSWGGGMPGGRTAWDEQPPVQPQLDPTRRTPRRM